MIKKAENKARCRSFDIVYKGQQKYEKQKNINCELKSQKIKL